MSGAAVCHAPAHPGPAVARPEPAWQALRAANVEWIVSGERTDELLGPNDRKWDEWTQCGAIETIKTGPHRTVYRLNLPCGEFYLKHFRVADWKARLRNIIRAAPAERELHAVQRIAALRLSTFEPVALGRVRQMGVTRDTWLITRAIPEAVPLDQFLLTDFAACSPACQAEMRQRLSRELGRLAARLHVAGIEHIDLHAGNLLIRPGAVGDQPLLSLIDLHAARFHRSLSQRQRNRNLAALHQFFSGRSTRSDRRRFWNEYQRELTLRSSAQATADDADRRGFFVAIESVSSAFRSVIDGSNSQHDDGAARLEELLRRAAQAGWRRADRAWRRGNRHVRRLDRGAVRCRGLATLQIGELEAIRDDPESLFGTHLIRWCKRSLRRRVAEVAPTARAYWKCIVESAGAARWFGRFRWSPVRRAWEVGHALLRRRIDTPRPLLFVESTDGDRRRCYLLTEAIANSLTLSAFFDREWTSMSHGQRSAWLWPRLRRLARQLRGLHDSGFDHRDLKFPNLLVSTAADDDRIWLLDLDAVRRWPWLPRTRAVQNLARLNVSSLLVRGISHVDRLRFLKWYLSQPSASEWRLWWRAISTLSQRKIARNQRVSRPLS